MGESLASFRELKGIGPATEARLHETGIYTWEALGAAATALASVRGNGDTLREIASAVAARRTAVDGEQTESRPPRNGERLEAFVLRLSLSARGEPQRCEVTHVRTSAEEVWAGWRPEELTGFVEKHARIRTAPAVRKEPQRKEVPRKEPRHEEALRKEVLRQAPEPRASEEAHSEHFVVLDAGKAIGPANRDVNLVVTRSTGGPFSYRATLAARGLGSDHNGGWTTLATQSGTSSGDELPLGFSEVQVPPGIQRLQLRLEVSLATPARRPPALALATS